MDFAFSEEQEAFRETLRRFLDERWPLAEVRRLMETSEGYDRGVWKQMAEEMGLLGLTIPEASGGQGFGFLELGIALEEMGRLLAGGPYFATVGLAAQAILNAGSEADRSAWLPGIAAGDTIATLAATDTGVDRTPDAITTECRRAGDGWRLSGSKRFVLDAQNADLVLVAARMPGSRGAEGLSLFVVNGDAPGLAVTPFETLDPTRKQAHVELEDAPARLIGVEGEAWPALARTLDQATIGLVAEMVGGAARCLETAVEYAKVRVQFARPIGSFQAVKHKTAEVLLEVESARSAAYWACWVASQATEKLEEAASVAKAFGGDAYRRAAAASIQVHGGIGFTWEHDAHLYYRRARSSDVLLGDAPTHRQRLADQLGFSGDA
jgi:alkylation response protein AidB-like acyl-CoA dehydrogenase